MRQIAKQLNVERSTVSSDIKAIKKDCENKSESVAVNVLPFEYTKCKISTDQIMKEC